MKKPVLVALCSVALIGIILIWSLSLPKGTVSVKGARAERVPNEPDVLHLVLQFENGDQPDLLLGATSDAAQNIALISTTGQSVVPIPSNSTPVLSTDGAYIRLTGIDEGLEEGRMIPVTLNFRHGKSLSTRAPISAPTDPHAAHRAMIANAASSAERDQPAPRLKMSVTARADGQWQVELELANFQFEPDSPDPVDQPGYGHA
ncbi:MAG: copper chaperone PCu(A)C, partial [Pseudomonadota bacterium]